MEESFVLLDDMENVDCYTSCKAFSPSPVV